MFISAERPGKLRRKGADAGARVCQDFLARVACPRRRCVGMLPARGRTCPAKGVLGMPPPITAPCQKVLAHPWCGAILSGPEARLEEPGIFILLTTLARQMGIWKIPVDGSGRAASVVFQN